jgi:hypothetical protein
VSAVSESREQVEVSFAEANPDSYDFVVGAVEHVQKMTDRLSRTAGLPGWLRDAILPVVGPRTYRESYGPLREPVVTGPSIKRPGT